MDHEHIQREISIIKNMIEKTKKDAAESGSLYLFIGVACIIYVLVVTILEELHFFPWVLPAMISMSVLFAIMAYRLVAREVRKEMVMTWPKKINRTILFVCSMTMILTGLVFPLTNVYPWPLSPVFAALLFGIMLFASGALYDLNFFYWSGLVSWAGAVIMAYTLSSTFPVRAIVMIVILICGFIVPAVILNKKYKNRSHEDESQTNS
jgi:hypothetical protein